jgi:serine/threonine-protein kinase
MSTKNPPARDDRRDSQPPAASGENPTEPSPASWAALVGLGAVAALWALFLWGELVLARAGGTPFCALGGDKGCAAIWDSSFASAVHRLTGLPIAAWGVVWGLVASALPLLGLLRTAEGKPMAMWVSATRLTAAAGAVTVFVMIAVSVSEGAFCLGCFGTYVIVAGYAGIALLGWRSAGLRDRGRGIAVAAGATALGFVLLLYPGMATPRAGGEAGRVAIAKTMARAAGTGDASRDRSLRELVESLDAPLQQTLSDSLHIYRRSTPLSLSPPRTLLGPAEAPVRITEFTDIRCEHCADLHRTLESLRERLPPDSFSVEPRQFPLDAQCNPLLRHASDPVRCLAAKVKICLEGHEKAREATTLLFENQGALTRDRVFSLTAPYVKRADLEACVASAETARKLDEDIRTAARYDPDGTPIVLVNGRQGTSFGPFLYAMVLTRGADAHPAFDSLPPPNPSAHIH